MPIPQIDNYDREDDYEEDEPYPGFWLMVDRIEAEHDYLESCGRW